MEWGFNTFSACENFTTHFKARTNIEELFYFECVDSERKTFFFSTVINCAIIDLLVHWVIECMYSFAGPSQDSNLFSLERLTPEKMLTLMCYQRRRSKICTKSSVGFFSLSAFAALLLIRCGFFTLIISFCFPFTVHNVKPECLDAYNELW